MGFFSRSNDTSRFSDEQAVERYRYMLRTAPPEMIEQAHEEAFERLTPEQRRLALEQLATAATPQERKHASEDPRSLARLATRAEIRQPGVLERLFGSAGSHGGPGTRGFGGGGGLGFGGAGMGMGGMLAGSLLASVAGTFIGSAIANSFFDHHPMPEGFSGDTGHDLATESGSGMDDTSEVEDSTADAAYDEGSLMDTEDVSSGFDTGDFDSGGGFDDLV